MFLMIFSVMGIIIGRQDSQKFEYNGYKFKTDGNFYVVEVNNELYGFSFFPTQVDYLNLSEDVVNILKTTPMFYITFNPNAPNIDLMYMDIIRKDLSEKMDKIIVNGVLSASADYALPVLTCQNATTHIPMIILNSSQETNIKTNKTCIVLNGQNTELLRLRDFLMYKVLGVIV